MQNTSVHTNFAKFKVLDKDAPQMSFLKEVFIVNQENGIYLLINMMRFLKILMKN